MPDDDTSREELINRAESALSALTEAEAASVIGRARQRDSRTKQQNAAQKLRQYLSGKPTKE